MNLLRYIVGCPAVLLVVLLMGCDSGSDDFAQSNDLYLSNNYIGERGTKYHYSIQTKTGDAVVSETYVAEVDTLNPLDRNYPYLITRTLPSGAREIFALQPDGPAFVGIEGTSPGGPYRVRYDPPIKLLDEQAQAPVGYSSTGHIEWILPDGGVRRGTYAYTVDLQGYKDVVTADRDYPDCLVVEVNWTETYDDYEIDRRETHLLAPGVGPVRSRVELDRSYPYDAVIQQTLHGIEMVN